MSQPFAWWILVAMVLACAAVFFLASYGTAAQALDPRSPLRRTPLRRFFNSSRGKPGSGRQHS